MAEKTWLNFVNLSDDYERKARFLPALITILFLFPLVAAFGGSLSEWIRVLVVGTGVGAAIAVGLSHLASAAGNRLQEKLWPRWPHDAPTHQWLQPTDSSRSEQQRTIWYGAIKRLTGLDIVAAQDRGEQELETAINDAISSLRNLLWKTEHANRLRIHNTDYGFARNFTGLRIVWLTESVISFIGCLAAYVWFGGGVIWCVIAAGFILVTFPLAFLLLPNFVRQKADYYTESFFGAMMKLDEAKTTGPKKITKKARNE